MSEILNDSSKGNCEICEKSAEIKCSACNVVLYCSVEHQREHWEEHRDVCKLFEICQSDVLGRHLKAKVNLNPSDIIFTDTPIVFGPKPHRISEGPFPCVGCCRLLNDQACEKCPECLWPVCKIDCPGLKIPEIHGFECNILKLKQDCQYFYENYRFDVLMVLRALYLRKTNQTKWEMMLSLQDHLKARGPNTKVYKSVQEKCSYLQNNYLEPMKKLEEENGQFTVSDGLIHQIYGILDVNAIEISEDVDVCVLYPTISLLEHNCTPNTIQIIDENDNFKATYRAALPIKEGEHITTIYTHILWGTTARRHHLKKTKYFVCACKRCQDPTEMGSFVNALKCMGTEKEPCGGIQLPKNPIEGNCQWICNKCDIKLPNKEIMKFVHHLSGEVDKIMGRHPNIGELEDILGKLLNFLHPNHYLVYSVKHSLIQLYGNESDVQASENILSNKVKMCEELIDITRNIDPGNTRLTLDLGVVLNEKFLGKFKLMLKCFDADKKEDYIDTVKELLDVIKESKNVLDYEKNSSAGSKLFGVICQNEGKFRNWIEKHDFKFD